MSGDRSGANRDGPLEPILEVSATEPPWRPVPKASVLARVRPETLTAREDPCFSELIVGVSGTYDGRVTSSDNATDLPSTRGA